jgi:predicted DCC family thiol-disulfide oxidoreductase YuxK
MDGGTRLAGRGGPLVRGQKQMVERNSQVTVYYDGSCALCRSEIDVYRRSDPEGRVRFEDVAGRTDDPATDLTRADAMARFHVRLADGTLVSGAQGFIRLWESLPGWRVLSRVARLPGVAQLLELGYRAFLPVRPVLSRAVARFAARRRARDQAGDDR